MLSIDVDPSTCHGRSQGKDKINAMDAYFYQMVERVLREGLAVVFGESPEEAGRRLLSVLN